MSGTPLWLLDAVLNPPIIHINKKKLPDTSRGSSKGSSHIWKVSPLAEDRIKINQLISYDNLLNEMMTHLREIIITLPPAQQDLFKNAETAFTTLNNSVANRRIQTGAEEMTTIVFSFVAAMMEDFIREVRLSNVMRAICPQSTIDHTGVKIDSLFQDVENEDRVYLGWENKSHKVFKDRVPEILQDAGDKKIYPINTLQTEVREERVSIVAKIAAILAHYRIPWGVLYSGLEFMIFYCHEEPDSGRPVLFASNNVAVNNKETPLFPLAIYMLLTMQDEDLRNTLVEKLKIPTHLMGPHAGSEFPKNQSDTSSDDQGTRLTEKRLTRGTNRASEAKEVGKALVLSTSPRDYKGSTTVFHRVGGAPKGHAHILLGPIVGDSSIGIVVKAFAADSTLVVKFSQDHDALAHEASVYTSLESKGLLIPRFYGHFQSHWSALVLSYEGDPVQDFATVPSKERQRLLSTLHTLHNSGFMHGDFAERNVVRSPPSLPTISATL